MKWTPQRVPNTRHQPMSAMVCRFVLCMSADCLILLVASDFLLLFSEMASVNAALSILHDARTAKLQIKPIATPGGERKLRVSAT